MLLYRNILTRLTVAALAAAAAQPAAKASFIFSPMPASLQSGLPYQPAAPSGKPAFGQKPVYAYDLTDGLLRTELAGPGPLGGPAAVDHAVQESEPKTVLPEPATIAILGAGLISLVFLRRAGA